MKAEQLRDHLAFWIFGMSNSFAFVVMLTAAQDIMSEQTHSSAHLDNNHANQTSVGCDAVIESHACTMKPLGPVLLANILPAFVIKMTVPFFMHKIPFSVLHVLVCIAQAMSYLIVAFTSSIEMSLVGVTFAALSSGLGDICYLALASHYDKDTISSWSSGTGGSGILGSLGYAVLTEPQLANLSPQTALLTMLVVPVLFFVAYFFILTPASTVYRPRLFNPLTWIVPKTEQLKLAQKSESESTNQIFYTDETSSQGSLEDVEKVVSSNKSHKLTMKQKLQTIYKLKKFILPLTLVYFADYLANQGMTEFFIFDCDHGFGLSSDSQYRWYQVIYFCGGFIARTTANFLHLPYFFLILFPIYEIANAAFFFFQSIHNVIPHISIIFLLVLGEGLVGGAAYANTYFRIHTEVDPSIKEFSLSITTMSDVIGIALAGLSTLPVHSIVCNYHAKST